MKKLIAILIVVITVLSSVSVVTALERPTLTVDRAVRRALGNSEQISRLADDVIIGEINGREIRRKISEVNSEAGLLSLYVQLMMHDISRAFQHSERAIQVSIITQNVQELFLAIINAEKALEFLDRQISIERQNLRFDRIRYEHGLLSVNDFDEARRRVQNLELDRERLETEINRAHRSLISVVGGNRDTRYSVELDLDFAPIKLRHLDYYVAAALGQNANYLRKQRELEVGRYEFEMGSSRDDDDRTRREILFHRDQRSIHQIRDDLINSITDLYDQIREQERSLTVMRANFETMLAQLAINEALFEMERITQIELDSFLLGLDKARDEIRVAEARYTMMVQRILNPNLH